MSLSIKSFVVLCAIQIAIPAFGATSKLFSKGAETFTVQDQAGKTPQFRILDNSPTEKALAVAVISALNSQEEVKPKIPRTQYVDLKVQSLTIQPVDANHLGLKVKLSGYQVPIDRTIDKTKFLNGEWIDLNFPKGDQSLALFNVSSSGRMRFRLDPKTSNLQFENVEARMNYFTAFGDEGGEQIRFSGRGIRN